MAVPRSGIPVSVELNDAAIHLWEFLKLVDSYPWLYEGLHVHNAVRRYETLWLPLVAQLDPTLQISAPLDIEWVWYVHMLSPYAYNRDCLHRFGKVVDHRISSPKERNVGLNNAREIWEKSYPKEEFGLDLMSPPKLSHTFRSKFSYDIFWAISRQRFFNYQVSLKHYRDVKFLKKAMKRYKDFLRARLQDPSLTLNGCFDVQIIWHAHLAHPVSYRDDTRQIFGEMLSHYDTDAGSGIVAWKASPAQEKNSLAPKSIPGSMYRGEAIICTKEKILLTQNQTELTFKVKLLKEEFQHTVLISSALQARHLVLTPCWFNLPSLSLACSSHVLNITQGKSDKVYDVKVIHSLAPVLSTVEIFHPKGHLLATAHTIAGKQIPMKSQLDDLKGTSCAYTPESKERALLIRSQKDWGVCLGKWVGRGESGDLAISFYNVETNQWQNVSQSNSASAEFTVYEVKIFKEAKSVFINLATGMVTVPYTDIATFVPEIIALTYAIGVLYVLCRERPREFYPVDPFQSHDLKSLHPSPLSKEIRASRLTKRDGIFSTGSAGKKSMWLNRDPFVSNVLLATGRNCAWIPSNSFLRFFQDNLKSVFEHCILRSKDDRSSVDAHLEIEYVLEYLGIKESPKASKNSQKKPKSHEKKDRKDLANGRALKAAKERFSNVQLNDLGDEKADEYSNQDSVFV